MFTSAKTAFSKLILISLSCNLHNCGMKTSIDLTVNTTTTMTLVQTQHNTHSAAVK